MTLSVLLCLNGGEEKKELPTDQMAVSNKGANYIWPSVLNCGSTFKLCYLFAGQGSLVRRDECQTSHKTFLALVATLVQWVFFKACSFFSFFFAVCRDFAVLEDHCLAHNLQEQESKCL